MASGSSSISKISDGRILQTERYNLNNLQSESTQAEEPLSSPTQGRLALLNLKVDDRREIDVGSLFVSDCSYIGDSRVVLACSNDGLKLLDKDYEVQSQLSDYSCCVATINNNQVIVTQGEMKKLQVVRVFPTMAIINTINIDRMCWGVYVRHNDIYVTCHDGPGRGEIRVLDLEGRPQRTVGMDGETYMLSSPSFIRVSRNGSKMFVSDWDTHTVTCLGKDGEVVYRYVDKGLRRPTGMYVDNDDVVLVCGEDSHNMHMIKRDGTKLKVWLAKKYGVIHRVKNPVCLSFRPSDGCLIVGCMVVQELATWIGTNKPLLVYETIDGR